MRSTEIVRSIDTANDQEISVSIAHNLGHGAGVYLADTTGFPQHHMRLTVAEARKLAEYLIEQADIADDLNA